jgi:hypothetical protein
VTIILEGAKLLTLAKGQYTLRPLAPGKFEMTVNSFTVNESGAMSSSRPSAALIPAVGV